eukprot:c39194_g1_i1 orf=1-189(-)
MKRRMYRVSTDRQEERNTEQWSISGGGWIRAIRNASISSIAGSVQSHQQENLRNAERKVRRTL